MELTRHQRLKGISQGIDVVHPSRPSKHVVRRHGEARVNHESKTQNRYGDHGLMGRAGDACEGAIDTRHDERRKVRGETEEEEVACVTAEMSHEVDQQVEDDHVDGLVGEINDVTGNGLGRLMVERIAVMLLDNRAFSINSKDLSC